MIGTDNTTDKNDSGEVNLLHNLASLLSPHGSGSAEIPDFSSNDTSNSTEEESYLR